MIIPAADPYQLADLFEDAYAARDVVGFVGLFDPQAVVATEGAAQHGSGAIGQWITEVWRRDLAYVCEVTAVHRAGGIAAVTVRWSMPGPDGRLGAGGTSVDVVRRQPDRSWRYLIVGDRLKAPGRTETPNQTSP